MPTSDLDRLLTVADAWRRMPFAIATVLKTWGSAPRPVGSHMLVAEDGRFEGSVSGGCVEGAVLHAASEAIRDRRVRRLKYGVSSEDAWHVGLPCGGEIEVLVQPVGQGFFDPSLFAEIASARSGGEGLTLATDLTTGATIKADRASLPSEHFLGEYLPPRRAFVVGAVEIARYLLPILSGMGLEATLIDPRSQFLTEDRFPGVRLDDRWPNEAIEAARPNASSAVITLSHDPKIDDPALFAALSTSTGYVAALGSTRSHAARLERLALMGVSSSDLSRIDGPAGIAIGALGPGEIAVSIAAGLIQSFSRAGATTTVSPTNPSRAPLGRLDAFVDVATARFSAEMAPAIYMPL